MTTKAASLTNDAGRSFHLDADQFRQMLLSRKFKAEAKELREQIAVLARTLASTIVDPKSLKALTNCRLILLTKNPDVRPVSFGEVLRRIMGKAINCILKDDIQESAGPWQTATGLKTGAEFAIHSVQFIFEDSSTEVVILVDADNPVNSISRKVALNNIQVTYPSFS